MIARQIFVSVLTMLMLLASTRASVHQMICLHSGNAEYSLTEIDCCKKDADSESLKRTCCEFFSFQYQTDDVLPTAAEKSFDIKFTSIPFVAHHDFKLHLTKEYERKNHQLPPPDELSLYIQFQRFLC